MFDGLFIVSIISSLFQGAKEACEPTIPSENWANKELYHRDIMDGVSAEQRMKNLKNGKYKTTTKIYSEPHRDAKTGKIIIDNCKLYYEDLKDYGAYQTQKWVEQGKYNLTSEELKNERNRLKAEMKRLYGI